MFNIYYLDYIQYLDLTNLICETDIINESVSLFEQC